ncbi:MAG: carboxypeptidase regulatory-like domain-containing protein [Thermoplasmata archaeon]|nr:MAG: carboxypeptidase regulatory-like domain-containing protein [Thermoplasmata archaeon]
MHITQKILVILLIFLLFSNFISMVKSSNGIWWDKQWKYRQEIDIPIDTSKEESKFQPIDIHVKFSHPCWAVNETVHSIRVIYQNGEEVEELESQIYNLKFIDESHIEECNIVFLIPDFATGVEHYYIYYDDTDKPSTNYIDHVSVEESYYRYEPISGYPLESYYYKIMDDNNIVYIVSQEGQFMGYSTSQHITKMKKDIKTVSPQNGELIAAFDFRYCYDTGIFDYSSTSQKLISKYVLVDGNLMIQLKLISTSKRDDLETVAIYTYYHCPNSNTRIQVHVHHEALKDIDVYPDVNTDGVFASLQCEGVRSSSIRELNIGEILPYLHIYSENNQTLEFPINRDPEYIPEDPDIRVIRWSDDIDIGKWVCFDEGSNGIAHGIIFDVNTTLQVNAFEMDYPHFPGLENNLAAVQIGRNSYEKGGTHSLHIPKGFSVEFNAEFFSTSTDGYPGVDREAGLFYKLIKMKPFSSNETEGSSRNDTRYSLIVIPHIAYSTPFGAPLSALTGLNLSFITVELYSRDEYISSGTAERLPIKPPPGIFDWRNISLFKKTRFPSLPPGEYIIKVYKENTLLSNDRRFIGFKTVNLSKNTTVHIYCSIEGKIRLTIEDQHENKIEDAQILLSSDNKVIVETLSENGETIITAPTGHKYNLEILYKGLIVYSEIISLKTYTHFYPITREIKFNRYNLTVHILDKWNLPLEVDAHPMLTNEEMQKPVYLHPVADPNGTYIFLDLPESEYYHLSLNYKSWHMEKLVSIPNDIIISFPVEYPVKIQLFDTHGLKIKADKLILERGGISNQVNKNSSLPPGIYHLTVLKDDKVIAKRNIDVFSNRIYNIVTFHQPLYPIIFFIGSIIIAVFAFYSYYKKRHLFISMIIIALNTSSFILPWWTIYGSSSNIESSTNLFLLPLKLITLTKTLSVAAGEISYLPYIFQLYIGSIPILILIGIILLISNIWFKKNIVSILSLLPFILSLVIFIVGVSLFTEIGVGGFIGSSDIPVVVPGSENTILHCNWGPNIGFILFLSSIILLIFNVFSNIRKPNPRILFL